MTNNYLMYFLCVKKCVCKAKKHSSLSYSLFSSNVLFCFSLLLSLYVFFLSTEKCDEALASPLPHTAFTSSSVFSSGYAPGYAKLNRRGGIQTYTDIRACGHTHTDKPTDVHVLTHICILLEGSAYMQCRQR